MTARALKRAARGALVTLLSLGPAALSRRGSRGSVVVLGYHDPKPDVLDAHLAALKARYTIIPLRDVATALAAGDLGRLPADALAVTLDDGACGNRALLPVLERHGVAPTVFLCTAIAGTSRRFWWNALDPAEQHHVKQLPDAERLRFLAERGFDEMAEAPPREALSLDEIREMAHQVDFEPHTRLHPVLTMCDDARLRGEVEGSKRELEELLGRECFALAYPVGAFGEREVRAAADAGYACAVTTEPGFVTAGSDPLRMPRILVRDDAPVRELLVRSSGVLGGLQRLLPKRAWSALQVR